MVKWWRARVVRRDRRRSGKVAAHARPAHREVWWTSDIAARDHTRTRARRQSHRAPPARQRLRRDRRQDERFTGGRLESVDGRLAEEVRRIEGINGERMRITISV